ncbi:MAG: NAD(P)/FAD-dependent oxidoreductase [Planctomycetes bacterium]|nr:NAD(P)/FAD-dependent oxidoreductase [Planctomycetota bacterium]MCB9909164.1 NAD(P)/FAD-dependent oxidoreductase [Planctomycetota bacterium]
MHDPSQQTLRVLGVPQELDEGPEVLRERACRQAGIRPQDLVGMRLALRSLDARRSRGILRFVCHVDLVVRTVHHSSALQKALRSGRVREAPVDQALEMPPTRRGGPPRQAVVVGSGPAGLFAALTLARNGAGVTLIDRGASLEQRHKRLVPFHRGGELDPDTNLLFGEGGAGTYSDGKLYTRVQDPLEQAILQELVLAGAPPEILYDGRAHIGTDRLHRILPALRQSLLDAGATILWDTKLEGMGFRKGPARRIDRVFTNRGELACDALFLALGHSARDTVEALSEQGLELAAKPFQFGVRIEHPQELINAGRFGEHPLAANLGAASYNLALKGEADVAGAHTFCMCPGGKIVASISEPGLLCTNGMSNSTHSSPFANAAVVTTIEPAAFAPFGTGPLAGLAFQRHFERSFFEAGGSSYRAPAQRVSDFLAGQASREVGRTSYTFGTTPGRIDHLLPAPIRAALARGLQRFDQLLPGFGGNSGILVGVESRSSSPLRMVRDRDTYLATGFENCYPIGEGAGYAGGIMSAAIDGARAAQVRLSQSSIR